MRERKTVILPVEILDNQNLSLSDIGLLGEILRNQFRFQKITVANLNTVLKETEKTIRKGLVKLTKSGYLSKDSRNNGWSVNFGKIYGNERENLPEETVKSPETNGKISLCKKEEKSTKKEDKNNKQEYIYNNILKEMENVDVESKTILTTPENNDKEKVKHSAGACAREEPEKPKESERFTKEYREIIDYLNEKTGKRYSATSRVNQGHISARLKEGFTVEDFKHVIDVKCFQWKDDPKMAKFLRPETLFGTKFDRYLNEEKVVMRMGLHGETYTVSEDDMNSDIPF